MATVSTSQPVSIRLLTQRIEGTTVVSKVFAGGHSSVLFQSYVRVTYAHVNCLFCVVLTRGTAAGCRRGVCPCSPRL